MNYLQDPLVQWCEHKYQYSPIIAEFSNSFSNTIYIGAALLSWLNHYRLSNRSLFYCDAAMMAVGVGSFYFHAAETFVSELTDEIAMTVLVYCYTVCIADIQRIRINWNYYISAVSTGLILYIVLRCYAIFLFIFLSQAAGAIYLMSTAQYNRRQRGYLIAATASIGVGKICWIYERSLFIRGLCPASPFDPAYFLHSYWHIGTAVGHYFIMSCLISMYNKMEYDSIDDYYV